MAHSNRKKIKASRGGMTKNQAMKAGRSGKQQERLRNVLQWQKEREEALIQAQKHNIKVEDKPMRKVNMWPSTIERRKGALTRLKVAVIAEERDVEKNAKESLELWRRTPRITRINNEISTLIKRI